LILKKKDGITWFEIQGLLIKNIFDEIFEYLNVL
jgi:hypothetical protein